MTDSELMCVDDILHNLKPERFRLSFVGLTELEQAYKEFRIKNKEHGNPENELLSPKFRISSFVPSKGKPINDFRDLSIIPLAEELGSDYKPFVRPAIIKGGYPNDNDYLDTQFRLMREDLVQRLREGISKHRTDSSDIYVYRDVHLEPPTLHYLTGEYIYYTTIKVSKHISNNKTMKYQSLVCLSSDNFEKDFMFAIVMDRDERLLKENKIGLKSEGNKFELDPNQDYSMVESSAYFESYCHVLKTLQSFGAKKRIPFSEYIVQMNTITNKPKYLNSDKCFDFSPLLTKETRAEIETTVFHLSELAKLSAENFEMNESQFEAFKYVLSTDLAVIQGPPGTGKSYIGSQIAKFLLNETNWNLSNPDPNDQRPLLVACYTNHALDQFLAHIAGFIDANDIVRVGSRCENPIVKPFMLHNKRHELHEARDKYNDLKKNLRMSLDRISENLELLIQLENRTASKAALGRSQHFGQIANSFLFEKFSTDEELAKWLTTYKRNETEYNFDVALIRQLVEWKIPQMTAKNAHAYALKNRRTKIDAAEIFHEIQAGKYKNVPSHLNDENCKSWLKLEDIDELIQLGYPEKLAIEILASVKATKLSGSKTSVIEVVRNEHKHMLTEFQQLSETDIYEAKLKLIHDYLNPKDEKKEKPESDNSNVTEKQKTKESSETDNFNVVEKQDDKEKGQSYKEWEAPAELKSYEHIIKQAPSMTENEAYQIIDIWELPLLSRWRLYQFWINEAQKARKLEINKADKNYRKNKRLLFEQKTMVDCEIIRRTKIVGMTTTNAAKYQSSLRSIKPRIVIVEEAAAVFEAHIITSLTEACEQLILIGDHKQLRPNPAVYDLAIKCHMNVSLLERLIKNAYPYKMLNYQRRMRPEISKLIKTHFYDDLMDHEVVENYPHVSGVTKDLFFINHKNPETTNKSDGSHKNVYEIKYALKLAKYFLQQGYKNEQVTILCTYSDQSIAMQREQKNVHGEKNCVRIETVDNFQGEESDIIILSLVRSENYENKIGFLKISNRKCVALSRAKHGLYVIGNMNFIASAEKENNNYLKEWESWESIIETAKKSESISETFVVKCQMHGNIQNIQKPEDFDVKCAEGGCQLKCERELPCGHICEKFCHGDDMDHAKTICHQPFEVEKTLGCEHKVLIQCHIETETVKCIEPCDRHLPCEHKCPKICNEQCPTFCKVLINGLLNCGHRSQYECSADPLKIKCMQPEKKYWPLCKHTVDSFCYVNHEHELCPHPCEAILQDCGHKCEGTCGGCSQGLLHQLCQQECKKQLFCGHKCKAKCFEACPPCERYCRTECGHSYCSKANVKGKGKIRFLNSDTAKKDTNGRKCGEACPPCMEPCLIACEHLKCTMKCGEKCNIQLCTKPCGRPLPCSKKIKGKISILHPCLGVCGDKECLQTLCQICNEDAIKKIMKESPLNIMNEELSYVNGKINNAFVQLDNCKHIFEVTSLDNYIKTAIGYLDEGEKEIIKLKCPLCHKPIFTSHRYNCYINEQGTDFENIKLKLREYSTDKNKQQKFEREAAEIMLILSEISLCDPNCFIVLNNSFDISPLEVTPMWLIAAKNFKRILSNLAFYAAKIEECNFATLTDGCKRVLEECGIYDCHVYLKQKFNAVFDRCAYIPFANELFEQLSSETKRFGFLINLLLYLNKFSNEFDIDEDIDIDHDSLKEILMEIKSNEKFKDDHKAWDLFENLKDLYSVPSQPMTTTICILEKVPQQIKWFKKRENYYF
uniref:NFX1-type zinc finger-containing protein 1 n=1 Tax=Panagrolaimus sp. PS1159 TaxID=55785 RepID=A0AC35G7H7_9BILA